MSRCMRGPNVAAALGPRSAGDVSVLGAALVKESTATENQQYHEDEEDRVRVHVVSLTSVEGPPAACCRSDCQHPKTES